MKIQHCLLSLCAVAILGFAAGYFIKSTAPVEADVVTETKVQKATSKDEVTIALLKKRIRDLEKALAEKPSPSQGDSIRPTAPAKEMPQEEMRDGPRRRGPDFRNFLKDMAKNDPKRFSQMTNRMAKMRSAHHAEFVKRIDTLESIDTSGMTDAQKDTHDKLQEALLRREELHEKMNKLRMEQVENHSEEDSEKTFQQMREMGQEMHSLSREIAELEKEERNTLLNQTMTTLGYNEEDSQVITDTIKSIYEATGEGSRMMRGGRHGGPPGPPGGM